MLWKYMLVVIFVVHLRLFLVRGESLPDGDAFIGRQGGQLIEWAVDLSHTLVLRVAIVVQHNDLKRPPRQLGRRNVEDKLLLELWTESSAMYATLQLSSVVWQQTETAERVGHAA